MFHFKSNVRKIYKIKNKKFSYLNFKIYALISAQTTENAITENVNVNQDGKVPIAPKKYAIAMDMDHVWTESANAMKDSSELTVQYSINAQKTVAVTVPVNKDNVNASVDGKI